MSALTRSVASTTLAAFALVTLSTIAPLHATARQKADANAKGGDKTAYAIAVSADGKPVPGMTKDEFAIREDGTDRAVTAAKVATDPIDVILIIDTAKPANSSIADLRAGLKVFATALFGGSAPVSMTIVDCAGSSITVAEHKTQLADVEKPLEKTFADQTGTDVMLEALSDAASQLAKSKMTRRAIVVVNMDAIPESSSLKSQDVLIKVAQSGASLWCVTYQNNDTKNLSIGGAAGAAGPSQATSNPAKATGGGIGAGNTGNSRDFVLDKAQALGGLRAKIAVPSAISETLTQLANILVGQYAVTFTRPDGPAPKLFQMATTREGVHVFASQFPVK